jgi:Chromate transporter
MAYSGNARRVIEPHRGLRPLLDFGVHCNGSLRVVEPRSDGRNRTARSDGCGGGGNVRDRMDAYPTALAISFLGQSRSNYWRRFCAGYILPLAAQHLARCIDTRLVLADSSGVMNPLILYLVLLKATVTTFSGLASIPVLHADLVVSRRVLTDQQLNIAIVVTRTTPGPAGLYVVSVGYFVDGVAGAIAGWAAMVTPALLVLPLIAYAGHRAEQPRVQSAIRRL